MTEPPSTPGPTHWFTLDWIETVTEVDTFAPHEPGDPLPMRDRDLHYAKRVGANGQAGAERLRDWHVNNDKWIPAGARRDGWFGPNISEIYDRNNGRAR